MKAGIQDISYKDFVRNGWLWNFWLHDVALLWKILSNCTRGDPNNVLSIHSSFTILLKIKQDPLSYQVIK